MKRRLFASIVLSAAFVSSINAMPAITRMIEYPQPDGTTVEVYLRGDEHFHYFETPEGDMALADDNGFLRYAELSADGLLCAGQWRIDEISGASAAALRVSDIPAMVAVDSYIRRQAPGAIQSTFPTTGSIRGLILLVEYQDVKMSELSTMEHYENMLNGENYQEGRIVGSVRDYFVSQSGGKFVPEFDIVGPVTLPHDRAFYGKEEKLVEHMRDACMVADADHGVDFSRYDADKDGFVDFVFLIYAGHGEAQGASAETIWPAMVDYKNYIFDYFDGLQLGVGACSCELSGNEKSPLALDGMGTICHEFSHILGLPDIYDPTYGSGYGMGHYDLLDSGGYNGDSFIPASYTAMDRFYAGWLEPMVLDQSQKDVVLRPLHESGEAYFVVNPANENEYYTLENRQWTGWDAALPGHGLVISRVTYDPDLWARNIVNAPGKSGLYEHVKIMAADNIWMANLQSTPQGSGNEAGDPFPGAKGKTEFSTNTLPRALWMSTEDTPCNFVIENIREMEDGSVMFDFTADTAGVGDMLTSDPDFGYDSASRTLYCASDVEIFTLAGVHVDSFAAGQVDLNHLGAGVYVAVSGDKSMKLILK